MWQCIQLSPGTPHDPAGCLHFLHPASSSPPARAAMQGFRTAQTRPNIQRVISFHSSMADPPLPIPGDGGREGQGGEEDGRQ